MTLNIKKTGQFCVIDLPVNIFADENSSQLKKVICEMVEQGVLDIILNLSEVQKIDGKGLGFLLNIQKIAFYNELNIRLFGLQPSVAQMIFQTRLNRIFDICQPEEEIVIEDSALIA